MRPFIVPRSRCAQSSFLERILSLLRTAVGAPSRCGATPAPHRVRPQSTPASPARRQQVRPLPAAPAPPAPPCRTAPKACLALLAYGSADPAPPSAPPSSPPADGPPVCAWGALCRRVNCVQICCHRKGPSHRLHPVSHSRGAATLHDPAYQTAPSAWI